MIKRSQMYGHFLWLNMVKMWSDGVRYDQMWSKDVSGSLGSRVLCCEGLVGIPRRIRTARDIKNLIEKKGGGLLKVYVTKRMHHLAIFLYN
jgi:hypothetical protein